jgi:ABC-type multidrug transport system ATPase subunit
LYAGLKGVPEADIPKLAEERLKAVRLWNVRHRPARTYSGGMKRRLSVIISTLGNPKVLFLDEPTTGKSIADNITHLEFIINLYDNAF